MAVVTKSENGNFPFDVYFLGKGIFKGNELPIVENANKVISLATKSVTTVANTAGETIPKAFSILDYMKEHWKILSIGAVALVVILKD